MQSKLRAIFEAICGVLSVGDAPTDALLHLNEPSGIPFSGTRCRTGYWLANSSPFFLLCFNGFNNLLLHQKVESGASSVVESVGLDFSISFSLQLLISWLAPNRRLDLTNGLARDHSALRFSSVSGIDQDLLID
jgi:hypothetical protein